MHIYAILVYFSVSDVEILEGGPSTLQKTHQPDVMEIVRDLRARIEVKKEVMEKEKHEHARRHAQLQSVVEAKIQEAADSVQEVCHLVAGTPTATGSLAGLAW
jgi:Ni,Fe-hydrogenase maturation factor